MEMEYNKEVAEVYVERNPDEFKRYLDDFYSEMKRLKSPDFKFNLNQEAYDFQLHAFFNNVSVTEAVRIAIGKFMIPNSELTDNEKRFIELELERCTVLKAFYDEYKMTLEKIHEESGIGHHFQDDKGIVYQLDIPTGTFVEYKTLTINRTRYEHEKAGTLSMKAARELGYTVEGK